MDYVNIVATDIISTQYDVFWNDVSEVTKGAAPRPVLVIVADCAAGSAQEQQLQKMLDACKLQQEQYNIIRLASGARYAWHQLRDMLEPKIVFAVGVMPAQLGISAAFRLNEPNNFGGSIWLPTLALDELEKYPDVKKQLWINGMKPLFVDKPIPA